LSRRRFCLPPCADAAFIVALLSSLCRRSIHRRATAPFIVAPPVLPLSSRYHSLSCRAAGSAFVIALPLPLSLRRRQFCNCCRAAAAFLVAPLLLLSSRCRSLHRRAAAPFIFAPPVLPSSSHPDLLM